MSGTLVVLGALLVVILVVMLVRRDRVRRRDETPEDRLRRDKLDLERSRAWLRKNRAAPRGVVGSGKWAARGAAGSGIWAAGGAAGLGIFAAGVANGGDGGDGWGGGDDAGQRRLDDPEDLVRLEIATALGRGHDVLVIPVLLGLTTMPAAADLLKPIASLAERNALQLTDQNWDDQVARLKRAVEKVVMPRVAPPVPLHLAAPRAEVPAGAVPRTQQREHAVATLAESVHLQWEEEAKIRGLFDPDPMPVHWTLAAHLTQRTGNPSL